ncbi:ATP-binding cassette domain-containing protein [Hominifimenecus sp. rT4P-3]|uniref:ABC transporter ATP-binding protein n=1 Tax=Hominifimenecus sp. rT4P-3 TaxID=3242979 RepID=UPI003DA5E63A
MIQVKNLVKRYGELIALDHFSLEVQDGEILGLLGPNGSGKTTAIHCILSLLTYDKGEISLFGEPMTPRSFDLKRQIGVVPQDVAVFQELTVQENIDYFCSLYVPEKETRKKLVEEAIRFVELDEFRKFLPGKLSGGLLRRLNIACGIVHRPKLIFLDEPTVAVDPQSRNRILEGIRELNRQGATIVYTSHYMEEVEQLCTRIVIMDKGREVATGTKEELKAMIRGGEKLTVETAGLSESLLEDIRKLPGIHHAAFDGERLTARGEGEGSALLAVLDLLRKNKIPVGRIFSEPPTLNDVFLEITGKELRD